MTTNIYEQLARIGKAISSPKRLELLDILIQGERTVELLANETKMTMGNTSQHLHALKEAHLVTSEKKGMFVFYKITNDAVKTFMNSLQNIAEENLIEVEYLKKQILEDSKNMECMDYHKFVQRIENNDVLLIDVRPIQEYNKSHIKGAVSVPLADLENYIENFSYDKEIVAYCRGKYCVLSVNAVEKLKEKGFKAKRLEDSVQDWKEKNLPIVFE